MGPKRRSIGSSYSSVGPTAPAQMKFRSFQDVNRATAKGTKPVPEPTSIGEIIINTLVYGCKKVLFLPSKYRLTAYAVLLFLASLVADYLPFPKSYFAYSDNIPNQYFVKFSWAWTMILVGIFILLTSWVYCAGDRKRLTRHFCRILIGTIVWFIWTNIFRIIEESTGQCFTQDGVLYSIKGRRNCSTKGGKWTSFDISGHAFLLMWCVFFITEEAKAIIGWDSIKDYIRNEEHNRTRTILAGSSVPTDLFSDTPLSHLNSEEFEKVKKSYGQFSTIANIQLVFLTLLTILWDSMIIATCMYFHIMVEKVIGGLIAALMWFILYRGFYTWDLPISPGLPGQGLFKYSPYVNPDKNYKAGAYASRSTSSTTSYISSTSNLPKSNDDLPKFMGMPLYALKK